MPTLAVFLLLNKEEIKFDNFLIFPPRCVVHNKKTDRKVDLFLEQSGTTQDSLEPGIHVCHWHFVCLEERFRAKEQVFALS